MVTSQPSRNSRSHVIVYRDAVVPLLSVVLLACGGLVSGEMVFHRRDHSDQGNYEHHHVYSVQTFEEGLVRKLRDTARTLFK